MRWLGRTINYVREGVLSMSLWGKLDEVVGSVGDVDKVVEKDEVRRGDRRSFWGEVDEVG